MICCCGHPRHPGEFCWCGCSIDEPVTYIDDDWSAHRGDPFIWKAKVPQ